MAFTPVYGLGVVPPTPKRTEIASPRPSPPAAGFLFLWLSL